MSQFLRVFLPTLSVPGRPAHLDYSRAWANCACSRCFPNRSALFLKEIHVSAEGVTKLLKGLNPSKALGPDKLHPRVLKELASDLGPMFAHLFQQSVDTG